LRYGQTYGSGYGDPENHLAWLDIDGTTSDKFIYVSFEPNPDLGDSYFSVFRNARLVTRIFVAAGEVSPTVIVSRDAGVPNSILVLDDGQMADTNFMNLDLVRSFEEGNTRPTIRWNWRYFVAGPDDQKTDNWVLTGLSYTDTVRNTLFPNQSDLSFDLTVTGSDVFVDVYNGTTTILSGTGTLGTTVSLTGTGLTGSVDVAADAITSTGNKVRLVWPDEFTVYRTNAGGVTQSTLGSTKFNFQNGGTIKETNDLAAGTYYYRGKFISAADDGDMSALTLTTSVVVATSPEPVTNLNIAAAGTAAATELTFTPSTTPLATYRLYLQRIGADRIDLYTIESTSSGSPIALPVITGFPGTVRALVRSVLAGNEDNYLTRININYDAAGDVIYGTPNVPQINILSIGYSGGNLQIPVIYNPENEAGVATTVKLYYRTDPADSWTAFGTQTLGSEINGVKKTSFNVTGLSPDMYYFAVSAITATASESDQSESTQGFECGTFTVTAPTLTIDLARS